MPHIFHYENVCHMCRKNNINNNDGSGKSSSTGSLSSSSNGGLKRMPFDERHLVPMLGSITITIVEKSDQDYYRCVVVTSSGQKAEQEFYLHVAGKCVVLCCTEIVKKKKLFHQTKSYHAY